MAEDQHVYTHPSRVEHWRHLIEIVALSLAAIWALYVFVYQERIKPANSAPSLDVSPVVMHSSMRNGKELVTVDVVQKNIGAVDLQVEAILVNVHGLKYGDGFAHSQDDTHHRTILLNSLPVKRDTLVMSSLRLFAPFGGSNTSDFRPNREKTTERSFALPQDAYDAVRVDYGVCYQRDDDRQGRKVTINRLSDGAYDVEAIAALENDSGISCPWGDAIIAL